MKELKVVDAVVAGLCESSREQLTEEVGSNPTPTANLRPCSANSGLSGLDDSGSTTENASR